MGNLRTVCDLCHLVRDCQTVEPDGLDIDVCYECKDGGRWAEWLMKTLVGPGKKVVSA